MPLSWAFLTAVLRTSFSPQYISVLFFASKKEIRIQFEVSCVRLYVILWGSLLLYFSHLLLVALAQKLASVVVQQITCFFAQLCYLITSQANFHSLSEPPVHKHPVGMGGSWSPA